MNSVCIICTDMMNPDEVLYVTRCGHLFHHTCLIRWIDTSRTCPQCRNATTSNCIFRFYPNVPSESREAPQSGLAEALKEKEDRLKALSDDLKKKEELLKSYEQKLRQAGAVPSSAQTNRGDVSTDQPSTSGGSASAAAPRTFRFNDVEPTQSRFPEPLQPLRPLQRLQPLPYLSSTDLMGNRSRAVDRAAAPAQRQADIPQLQPMQYLTMPVDLKKDLENALNAALQKDLQYKIRKLRLNRLDSLG